MAQRRRNRRWISVVVFFVLIVAAIAIMAVAMNNIFGGETKEQNQNSNVNVESSRSEEKPDQKNEDAKDEVKKEEIQQYDGDDPNEADNLTGVISYASVNEDKLIIRVNIDQFLSKGNCNLNILKNGATLYSETVEIQGSVSTSTCNGFSVPVSELSSGDLQLEINLESEGKTGRVTGKVRI